MPFDAVDPHDLRPAQQHAVAVGLLPGLASLVRRHRVVVAAVADPRVAAMAAGRADSGAVYDAAAASEMFAHE